MITYGTEHLTAETFGMAFNIAQAGDQIVYAIGDLATSRAAGSELNALAKRAMHLAENGFVCLTQRVMPELDFRNGGGRSFEYRATKCNKTSPRTRSLRSSSPAGALVTV